MGNIDLDVVKKAGSWSEGIRNYQEQKLQPVNTEASQPLYVTRYMKSREEAAINPITQKFNDVSTEKTLRQVEKGSVAKILNRAWDTQLGREQHFDIINQKPKRGHIHEVPYVQRLKPPSLITANNENYNIISTLGLHDHHWAPPGKRPPRVHTPPRKEPFLTAVNRPRQYDIVNNRFREHHDSRSKWEMDQARSHIVNKYWETHDFDPVTCSYYDEDKEKYYQKRIQEMLLTQGTNAINKLPPTLAASESLMYDICTGVVKDPQRLQQKIEADRAALENRASKIGAEELMRVKGEVDNQRDVGRKMARIAHTRYLDVTERGFNILSNESFDKAGHPPLPLTRPRKSLWEFRESLREDKLSRTHNPSASTHSGTGNGSNAPMTPNDLAAGAAMRATPSGSTPGPGGPALERTLPLPRSSRARPTSEGASLGGGGGGGGGG
eukprot:CAMPEP_0181288654 /NCGR_PEP_ID=MMETSP1101-20121128/452_1 /TAXON_ID=46948 /ORGANISM="Rhodomonas abbreviata, Strain Caron Lab Isolate" /LENGTH=439 /DNA_ID=CAMNT_0023392799 /DNA_START=235 /DNA_END=1550 /DNA_ORIENTATION=+